MNKQILLINNKKKMLLYKTKPRLNKNNTKIFQLNAQFNQKSQNLNK